MKEEKGVFIGANKTNQKPILFNTIKCNAYQNGTVFGELGVGKQFRMKEVLSGQENIVIFDPEREFENIKDSLVNNCVDLNSQINPFEIHLKD